MHLSRMFLINPLGEENNIDRAFRRLDANFILSFAENLKLIKSVYPKVAFLAYVYLYFAVMDYLSLTNKRAKRNSSLAVYS